MFFYILVGNVILEVQIICVENVFVVYRVFGIDKIKKIQLFINWFLFFKIVYVMIVKYNVSQQYYIKIKLFFYFILDRRKRIIIVQVEIIFSILIYMFLNIYVYLFIFRFFFIILFQKFKVWNLKLVIMGFCIDQILVLFFFIQIIYEGIKN